MPNMAPVNESKVTAVGVALTELLLLDLPPNVNVLTISLGVEDNAIAVDQFEIRGTIGDTEHTLASVSADYTSPSYPLLDASGDLAAQAANTAGYVIMDPRGFSRIRVLAACALAGPTDLTLEANSDRGDA